MSDPQRMHKHDATMIALREKIFEYSRERMEMDPPLDGSASFTELRSRMPDSPKCP